MNKNVLKSQNIGEGMISVHDGQNSCWSHRERSAIGIWADERLALFLRNTYNVGFSLYPPQRSYYTPRNEVRGGILESPCPSERETL